MTSFSKAVLATVALVSYLGVGSPAQAADAATRTIDLGHTGFKSDQEAINYFTVSDTTIREVGSGLTPEAATSFYDATTNTASSIATEIGAVVADPSSITAWVTLGQRVWQVVVNNRPIVNVATQRISVLPRSNPNWTEMSNWRGPASRTYVLEMKNLYGMTVIRHAYTIAFNYGGQLNGRGAFLANATIIPAVTDVAWAYTLNSRVDVGDVVNTGSVDNPTPGVNLELQYSVKTVLAHSEGRNNFFVRGDGAIAHVTSAAR